MGVDISAYVGPYAVCSKNKKAVTKKVMGCPKGCAIKVASDINFCPKCGSQITEIDTQHIEEFYVYDVTEDLQEVKCTSPAVKDKAVLLPNKMGHHFDCKHEITCQELDANTQKEKEDFLQFMKDSLGQHFDELQDVEIKWGFINWMW